MEDQTITFGHNPLHLSELNGVFVCTQSLPSCHENNSSNDTMPVHGGTSSSNITISFPKPITTDPNNKHAQEDRLIRNQLEVNIRTLVAAALQFDNSSGNYKIFFLSEHIATE